MNVVLPELDGRIASRAVSFKAEDHWDERTQCRIATYKPLGDRVEFVAEQARQWIVLQRTPSVGAQDCDHPRKLSQQGRAHRQRRRL